MNSYDRYRETERYVAELKQLLASSELTPDTRARCLATLIDAESLTETADKINRAAQTTMGDTVPLLLSAAKKFGDEAGNLISAMDRFEDSARTLAAGLQGLPEY